MPKQLENGPNGIQSDIIKHLKSEGFFVTKIESVSVRGLPDLFAYRYSPKTINDFYFFEVKQPGKDPTPIQQYQIDGLNAGGLEVAHVVRSVEDVKIILRSRL